MPLTDTAIRKVKPAGNTQRLFDGGGLYLELSPAGGKWWRLKYRFDGKEKRLSLGVYPDVGLAGARIRRDEARKLLASGIDPSEHRKATKATRAERAANSYEAVAREWFGKQSKAWVKGHADKILRRQEADIFPWLGGRPIAEITPRELLTAINRVVDRGAVESAHRVLQNCNSIFRYAIVTSRAETNPALALRDALPPVKPTHHAAVTDPAALSGLLRAIDGYAGSFITKCALRLAPLVFVRPGELRKAEWTEFDLDAAQWNIPAERMKMREPHLVPLSAPAVAILTDLHALTGRGRYVFPGLRDANRPMSENTVNAALRRMGFDKDTMTGHGFRAIARTILDEVLQVRPDYIEHQLAHAVKDPNGRAYNRTAHLKERIAMMQQWADYLDNLKTGGTVLSFPKKSGARR
jgi:integrase